MSRISLPKISSGSLHLKWVRCGHPNCRCTRGAKHGPYLYHHWRVNGRQKKSYVPMSKLVEALDAIDRLKIDVSRVSLARRALRECCHE